MTVHLRPEDDQTPDPEPPLNREDRRKKRWRPEQDLHANRAQTSDRLRDTRSRASFVRRLGPR